MKKILVLVFAIIINIANGQDNEPTPMKFKCHISLDSSKMECNNRSN